MWVMPWCTLGPSCRLCRECSRESGFSVAPTLLGCRHLPSVWLPPLGLLQVICAFVFILRIILRSCLRMGKDVWTEMTSQDLTDVGLVEFYHPEQQQDDQVRMREALLSLLGAVDGGGRGSNHNNMGSDAALRRRLPRRIASTRSLSSQVTPDDWAH